MESPGSRSFASSSGPSRSTTSAPCAGIRAGAEQVLGDAESAMLPGVRVKATYRAEMVA
jgi:hypothetical protein